MNADEGVRVTSLVPDLHVFPVVPVADSFQAAKDALFPDDDRAIVHWEISDSGDQYHLSVMSAV